MSTLLTTIALARRLYAIPDRPEEDPVLFAYAMIFLLVVVVSR